MLHLLEKQTWTCSLESCPVESVATSVRSVAARVRGRVNEVFIRSCFCTITCLACCLFLAAPPVNVSQTAAWADSGVSAFGGSGGSTDSSDSSSQSSTETKNKIQKFSDKDVMSKGASRIYKFDSSRGRGIKCTSKNKKIVKVKKLGKRKFKLIARKNGTTVVAFKSKTILWKHKVVVSSGNKFVNKWAKNVAKQIKAITKNTKERLLYASMYVIGNFKYANVYDLEKAISKRKGTCHSGGKVLVKICKALGYKAKTRFAANDKMSRYPKGIIFYANHYNVKVTAKKKTYFLDATPGSRVAYLSTSKKPLMECVQTGGSTWTRVL